ncbi:sorting and assembly machinery component 50 homolog B-like isoform X2 [Tubulanus polymorphus]|uniref:sorting and assembly machinery component 50 homolog B-like isoform X2 n=1 Tax=Tubulanus polymorphus TaxID=672921 RepID=UPI003DA4014D
MGTVHAKSVNPRSQTFSETPQSQRKNREVDLDKIPARVQRVYVEGLQRTKDDLVAREVKGVFSASSFSEVVEKANEARYKLEKLGIFKNISLTIDTSKGSDAREDGYDVIFEVNESRRITGGINTLIGNNDASLLFALKFPNTFGRAERFNIDYTHGTKHSSGCNVSFIKPFELNPDAKISASIYESHGEYPWSGFKETDRGINFDISFPSALGSHNLMWEGVWRELNPLGKTTAFAIREQCGHSLKSSFKHIFQRDGRDSRIIPTDGSLLRLIQEYAGLGGDVQFIKHEVECQFNKSINDTTFQLSLAGGMMKSLNPEKQTLVNDRFFLGGPMTLRGFNVKGVGPHCDGSALGAESYWLCGLHMYTPLPFRPGRGGFGDLFRTHFFVNAGNLTNVDFTKDLKYNLAHLAQGLRLAYGAGLVLKMGGIARLELNYCFPVKSQQGDAVNTGLQFGIGVTFL